VYRVVELELELEQPEFYPGTFFGNFPANFRNPPMSELKSPYDGPFVVIAVTIRSVPLVTVVSHSVI